MEARLPPCIPLPLSQEELDDISDKAKDWALMHGACMRSKTNFSKDSLNFAPFALLPSTFPKKEFERAIFLQTIINELMHKVAHDHTFLEDSLKHTIKVDDFTGRLYKLYETVRQEGFAQPMSLGLVRSDLMLETTCDGGSQRPYCCWKQVEFNTIASGFGWLGPSSCHLHRYVLRELGHPEMIQSIPQNNALQGLCGGMIEAWKVFGDKHAVILFIIEDITINICDQRFLEFEIRNMNPEVGVIRRTLTQIADSSTLGKTKELLVGKHKVAVVYFRAGYEPGHYMSEKEWDARLTIERSTAIKCPSIHYQLAGTKKVQQTLSAPGCLERYFDDVDKMEAVRSIFTGLYSLDHTKEGDRSIEKALAEPDKYVLKPQREGGGNNIYGEEIRATLMAMQNSEERSAWILMDRIQPPVQANYLVRPGHPMEGTEDIVSELGIFGVVIGDENNIKTNKQVGFMLRSKSQSSNEGGVAAGAGVLDSPFLT